MSLPGSGLLDDLCGTLGVILTFYDDVTQCRHYMGAVFAK